MAVPPMRMPLRRGSAAMVRSVSVAVLSRMSSTVFRLRRAMAAISPDMVNTTWKVRTGRMSRALAFIHPPAGGGTLASWAVPVPAGGVPGMLAPASVALIEMAAEDGGSTGLDGGHDLDPAWAGPARRKISATPAWSCATDQEAFRRRKPETG